MEMHMRILLETTMCKTWMSLNFFAATSSTLCCTLFLECGLLGTWSCIHLASQRWRNPAYGMSPWATLTSRRRSREACGAGVSLWCNPFLDSTRPRGRRGSRPWGRFVVRFVRGWFRLERRSVLGRYGQCRVLCTRLLQWFPHLRVVHSRAMDQFVPGVLQHRPIYTKHPHGSSVESLFLSYF